MPSDVDLCVCTDLDEVFETGWRKKLEESYDGSTRVRYNYNWSLDEYNKPLVNFYIEKIHIRKGYKWTHPVHEVLTPIDITEKTKGIPDLNTRINIIITTNKETVEIIVISLDAEFELS